MYPFSCFTYIHNEKLLTPGSEQICKNLLGTHAHSKIAGLLADDGGG
jgi:hypothetical protein